MTELDQTEKLVRYVANMHDRSEEYDVDYVEVLKESEEDSEIGPIIDGIVGRTICTLCEKKKMFDEKNGEYYCPIHDK